MAEFAGTLLLMLVVVGVGLTTGRGSPTLGVMAEALGVAGALVGLIIAFGRVSGGHFNPLITFLQWLSGIRDLSCTIAYVAAQVAGGIVGALTGALMFGVFGPHSAAPFIKPGLAVSEFIASAGLMIIVFGLYPRWSVRRGAVRRRRVARGGDHGNPFRLLCEPRNRARRNLRDGSGVPSRRHRVPIRACTGRWGPSRSRHSEFLLPRTFWGIAGASGCREERWMTIVAMPPQASHVRTRLIAVYSFLVLLNVGGWVWAAIAFHATPVLLGVALLVYGLGLRHAVDADHIAAIDNVTRKLMQAGQRPVAVGFFFAAGHSALVIFATALIIGTATLFDRFRAFSSIGGLLSTAVSIVFLYAIAAMNLLIFVSLYRIYRKVRNGGIYVEEDIDPLLGGRGFLARVFRPVFRLVTKSWHMLPLGILFGLGFDTATEIAMFGVSAGQATRGISTAAIMILPVLFAAGMSLMDTTDGVMMLGAYDWAFVQPLRKLYYNMTITLVSAVVAALVAGLEAVGLVGGRFGFTGYLWEQVKALNSHFNTLGFAIIGLFALAWALSWVIYSAKRLDQCEVRIEASARPSNL